MFSVEMLTNYSSVSFIEVINIILSQNSKTRKTQTTVFQKPIELRISSVFIYLYSPFFFPPLYLLVSEQTAQLYYKCSIALHR